MDETERNRVFESAPEREQTADAERKGVAVIGDLDRIEGVLAKGPRGTGIRSTGPRGGLKAAGGDDAW